MKQQKIVIVGAGIAGCFFALLLSEKGFDVTIYERMSWEMLLKESTQRSYNVTFYGYAVDMLKKIGVWEEVSKEAVKMDQIITHVGLTGHTGISHFGSDTPYYSVKRSTVLRALVQKAKKIPRIQIFTNATLIEVQKEKKEVIFQMGRSQKHRRVHADIVVGADGVYSTVRHFLQQYQSSHHSVEYAGWTYKQILLPPQDAYILHFKTNNAYTWTRKDAMLVAFPNADKSWSMLLSTSKNSPQSISTLQSKSHIQTFIQDNFPQFLPVLPTITDELLKNTEGYFITLQTNPWYYKDFLVLIGDSAHSFLPFYGQGMSSTFADAMYLIKLYEKHNNWEKVFALYQDRRKKSTDILAELSKKAFKTYTRYKKADYDAIYDKLEFLAFRVAPKIFPKPLAIAVMQDNEGTSLYKNEYDKKRKLVSMFGFGTLAKACTLALSLLEF